MKIIKATIDFCIYFYSEQVSYVHSENLCEDINITRNFANSIKTAPEGGR